MKIEVLTIFPEIFESFLNTSLIAKAIAKSALSVTVTDIRDFADLPHRTVDDSPYGGGAGMVMKPEPIARAILAAQERLPGAPVIALIPAGKPFTQQKAREYSQVGSLILLCGRYEGIDERVIDRYVDEEISIGDYVLMGGEVPAMVIIEAATRLVDSVIGNAESLQSESFNEESAGQLLEAPQYTRPPHFEGLGIPDALLSGDHARIKKWREEQSLIRTKQRRPDLIK